MSILQEPPKLEHRVKTLGEKLFKRIDQQPDKQPVGFVITDFENTRKGAGIGSSLFYGTFMLLFGAFFIFSGWVGNIISLLFGLLPVLVGIRSLWSVPVKLQSLKRADPGELILKSYPLRLGETMTLTFRRYLKTGYQVKTEGRVWGRLICLEVYMDDRGSGSASFYGESVWYQDLPALFVLPGVSCIEQDWHIRIPSDGTPSIRIGGSRESNCVLWGIDVWLDIPGLIKEDSVFCLLVEPELV